MLCSKKGVFFQSPRCSHLHLLSREKMHAVLGCGSKSVHGDIIQKDIRNIAHSHTLCSTPHTHTHFTANKVLPASSGQAPDHTHTHTRLFSNCLTRFSLVTERGSVWTATFERCFCFHMDLGAGRPPEAPPPGTCGWTQTLTWGAPPSQRQKKKNYL